MTTMKRRGFTVIELLVIIVILGIGSWLFFTERATVNSEQRDSTRKTAINAMYYNLEEVYFEAHNNYPQTIDSKTLRAMDPALFTDPSDVKLGETGSDYRYEPTGCNTSGQCSGYTLRSAMEREADFVKTNRNK